MTKWIAAAIVVFPLILSGSAAINSAAAAPQTAVPSPDTLQASELSARGRTRHRTHYFHGGYHQPHYYDRPYYYAPAPFIPFNFGYPLLPPPWW
jgi:hypothetical protein